MENGVTVRDDDLVPFWPDLRQTLYSYLRAGWLAFYLGFVVFSVIWMGHIPEKRVPHVGYLFCLLGCPPLLFWLKAYLGSRSPKKMDAELFDSHPRYIRASGALARAGIWANPHPETCDERGNFVPEIGAANQYGFAVELSDAELEELTQSLGELGRMKMARGLYLEAQRLDSLLTKIEKARHLDPGWTKEAHD